MGMEIKEDRQRQRMKRDQSKRGLEKGKGMSQRNVMQPFQ